MAVEESTERENAVEVQVHRRNYVAFTRLLKWSTIAALVIGYLVMLIISD